MPQYASEYHDPVKAHEYYMRTRKLKGRRRRRSTAGLNEEGRRIASVVKVVYILSIQPNGKEPGKNTKKICRH